MGGAALDALTQRLAAAPNDPNALNYQQLRSVVTPNLRDRTAALAGPATVGGLALDAGILIVRDCRYPFVFVATGPDADPLADLQAIAACRFAAPCDRAGLAPPSAAYQIGPLWDRLPTLWHLPPGFALAEQTDRIPLLPTK